jgi:YebC/PmpR family DNA-binding regulatory protein
MSGHSKWQNVKYRKERQDKKRSNLFAKLIKEITLQARHGEPNPAHNPGLAQALERARAANLPKENIERAIKRATGELEGAEYEEIIYEGYAPEGVAILLRVVTDNRNRAAAAIRHIFTKRGGNLAAAGSVAWLFTRRGIVILDEIPEKTDREALLMTLIDHGAQEFEEQDDLIELYCASEDLVPLAEAVRKLGITPRRAEITMVPRKTVKVSGASAAKVLNLINELDDNEDVQEVYANFDIPDEIMAHVIESGG